MTRDAVMLEGGCACGALRYSTSAEPFAADYCHCDVCRRTSGAVVSVWMDFRVEQVDWKDGRAPREYASSAHIRRGFCPECGATMSYRHTEHPDFISLSVGTLDDPSRVQPTYHIHVASQVPWLVIQDECERYPEGQ